jgi:hypothetical protein
MQHNSHFPKADHEEVDQVAPVLLAQFQFGSEPYIDVHGSKFVARRK